MMDMEFTSLGRANGHSFKLAIGLPVTDQKVYTQFFTSFTVMEKPDYTLMLPIYPGRIEEMRNQIVEQALEHQCTHLLMMDTDQVYPADMVMRLMTDAQQGHDVVGAVVHRRYPPFDALLYRGELGKYKHVPDEEIYNHQSAPQEPAGSSTIINHQSLVEVDATGCGCILYRMRVFTEIERPWFEVTVGADGKPVGEDIGFCSKLRAAGVRICVDTSVQVGHLSLMEVNEQTYRLYKKLKEYEWATEAQS